MDKKQVWQVRALNWEEDMLANIAIPAASPVRTSGTGVISTCVSGNQNAKHPQSPFHELCQTCAAIHLVELSTQSFRGVKPPSEAAYPTAAGTAVFRHPRQTLCNHPKRETARFSPSTPLSTPEDRRESR